jgi:hypothetical protein
LKAKLNILIISYQFPTWSRLAEESLKVIAKIGDTIKKGTKN